MIRLQHVSKNYGPLEAVRDVSFEVARGEIVGFLGPNGAGKSTTLRMIAGFLHADRGTIQIGDHDLRRDPLAARASTGYLPESTPLYRGMRVRGYVDFAARVRGLGGRARRAAVDRALERCDLGAVTGRRIAELSKGYRQRVGLAQALVGDADVLLLDEPTSGLDPAEVVRMRRLVVALAEEATVLVSSHVLAEVQELAQRVLILAGGRLVADGTPAELAREESGELLVTLRAPHAEAQAALSGLSGVERVRAAGRDGAERVTLGLTAPLTAELAERVAALCAERGWALSELRAERASLETVFLRRVAGQAGGAAAPGSGDALDPGSPSGPGSGPGAGGVEA